jgi:hypothetical protein
MKSQTTQTFWNHYRMLPLEIRQKTKRAYVLWRNNPNHPGLFFKRIKAEQPVYSVRIGLSYRAMGLLKADTITWFWIGSHDEYDRLIG